MKIGAFHIIRALETSRRGQAINEALHRMADRWQAEAEAVQRRLAEIQGQLEKQVSDDADLGLERDRQLARLELKQIEERAKAELELEREHLKAQLFREIHGLAKTMADERGLSVVLALPSSDVVYVTPEVDLTDALIARLDAAFAEGPRRPASSTRARPEGARADLRARSAFARPKDPAAPSR